jgi:hypothetical protein
MQLESALHVSLDVPMLRAKDGISDRLSGSGSSGCTVDFADQLVWEA